MDREEIDDTLKKAVKLIDSFTAEPTYEKALYLDMTLSIFRLLIGSDSFDHLHYFKMTHEDVIAYIEKHRKVAAHEQK